MSSASYLVVAIVVTLLTQPGAGASSVRREAVSVVTRFCREVMSPRGFSYWEFEGRHRQRMKPLLSKRLLAHLDNVHGCVRDWARHQPPDSSYKPPGVDCCVFSASADWSPTSFSVQESSLLPDSRYRFTVEYKFDSPVEHGTWHVAIYVKKEGDHYVVDDFEGGLDDPPSERWFVAKDDPQCKEGKWVGAY